MTRKVLDISFPLPCKGVTSIEVWLLLTFLVWPRLPFAFGMESRASLRLLSLVPLMIGISLFFARKRAYLVRKPSVPLWAHLFVWGWVFWSVWAFAYAFVLGEVSRFNVVGNGFYLLLVGVYGLYLAFKGLQGNFECLAAGIFYAGLLYIGVNLAFYALHIGNPSPILRSPVQASMLTIMGIRTYRVEFPLAHTLNSLAYVSGAVMVGSWSLLQQYPRWRYAMLTLFVWLLGIVIILLCDARAAVLITLVAVGSVLVSSAFFGKRKRAPAWFSLALIAGALLLPALLLQALRLLPPNLQESLSRHAGDLSTFSNRTVIWNVIFASVRRWDVFHLLVGWGYRGQISTGIMREYAFLFNRYQLAADQNILAHNTFLQVFIEGGSIGILLFIGTLFHTLRLLQQRVILYYSRWANTLYGMVVFLSWRARLIRCFLLISKKLFPFFS